MTHQELIAALTEATGHDAELDKAIAFAVGWVFRPTDSMLRWISPDNIPHSLPPEFTKSIDAAMTLVEPEWRVYAIQEEYITPRGNWFAGLDHRTEHYKNGSMIGKSSTPAIALCIAALKARAQTEGGK